MFTESQTRRIAQRATIALVKAIDTFPDYLTDSEAEHAASVVADIIKTQLTRPQPAQPEQDPGERLAAIILACNAAADAGRDREPQHAAQSQP